MDETKVKVIPETEEPGNLYMQPGLHLVKPIEVVSTQNGKAITYTKDGQTYSGINIKFKNQAGEIMDMNFFYTTDAEHKCPIEFMLSRLKIAMGLNCKKQQTIEEFCAKKVWAQVAKKNITDTKGKQIYKGGKPVFYSELTGNFYPYQDGSSKPIVDGCPGEGKEPSGTFLTTYARDLKEGETTVKPAGENYTAKESVATETKKEEKPEVKKTDATDLEGW